MKTLVPILLARRRRATTNDLANQPTHPPPPTHSDRLPMVFIKNKHKGRISVKTSGAFGDCGARDQKHLRGPCSLKFLSFFLGVGLHKCRAMAPLDPP